MLAQTPEDLEQLAEAVAFQKRLADDKARIAGRFEPLRCVVAASSAIPLTLIQLHIAAASMSVQPDACAPPL